MTIVSQAFVSVRPNLDDFNAELRTKLATALKVNVADRTVLIRATFEKGTREALINQLPKAALPVLVKPVLVDGAAADIRREIGIVPVEVALVGGQAAKKAASDIAAAAAVSAPTRTGTVAADTQQQAQAAATRAAARKAAADAAAATVGNPEADRLVLEATNALVGATAELEAVTKALTLANEALVASETELTAATSAGNKNREARAALTNASANATQRQAQLDFDAAAAAKTAADSQAVSAERVLKVKTAVTAAAQAAGAAEITHANEVELNVAANAAAALATSEYTKAMNANDAAAANEILQLKVQAVQTQELIEARLRLTEVSGLTGAVSTAGRSGGTDAAKVAQLELTAAKKADTEATEVLAVAQASGNAETIAAATAAATQTRELVLQTEANVALLKSEQARGPALARIAAINTSIARASDPTLTLAQRATAATSAHVAATKAVEQFAVAESGASQKDRERIVALEGETLALKEQTVAQNRASVAAAKAADSLKASAASSATFRAQAERGAAATGATFLGLRGAVLSASTGFLAATVAVTGLGKIVQTAEELQQSLNVFQSVSKATADQMLAVDVRARQLGADLSLPATSALDAAEAMTTLAKAGLSVDQTLAAAKGVLQLAAAANIDVGDSANIVATELNAFGLAGEKATNVANLLAGASIAAQGDISDFALAFQQASAVAHQVGLSLETTTAVLTQFAKAGLHGSDAGTSLRTLLLRLVPTTKAASDAQAELGIKINRNIPIGQQFTGLVEQYTKALQNLTPVAQQEILTKIFGQDAIRGAAITFTQGSALLNDIQKTVSAPGQVQELARARTEGLGGAVEGLKSEVQTLAATIGSQTLPLLTSMARGIGEVAQNANAAVTAFNKLAKITIRPIGNIFGGVDTLTQVGLAAIVGLGARSLLQGRANKVVNEQLSKAVLEVNEALAKQSITQDEVNALWEIMGISAEEATIIQVRAVQQQEKALDQLKLKQEQLATIRAEAPGILAGAPSARIQEKVSTVAVGAVDEAAAAAAASVAGIGTAAQQASLAVDEAGTAMQSSLAKVKVEGLGIGLGLTAGLEGAALAAVKSADVQVGAANNITTALQRIAVVQKELAVGSEATAAAAVAGEVKQTTGFLSGLKARAAAISATQAGVGAGIGLSLAGGAIGGGTGSFLSAAGSGAVLGSFLPLPPVVGPVVGAAAFGGLELLKGAQEASKKREEETKAKWAGMTFAQQQTFLLLHFPERALPDAPRTLLADAVAKAAEANKFPDFTPQPVSARPFPSPRADPTQEQKLRDLLSQTDLASPQNDPFRVPNRLGATFRPKTAADFVKEQGGFNIPTAALVTFEQASSSEIAALSAASSAVGKVAKARADLKARLDALFAPGLSLKAAGLSITDESGIKEVTVRQTLTTEQLDALAVSTAQLSGSTEELRTAYEKQAKDQQNTVNFLKKRFTRALTGEIDLSAQDLAKLATALINANNNLKTTKDALDSLVETNKAFQLPTDITIAGITAGTTKTLTDDLAAKQAALAAITKALNEHSNKTKADKDAINALRIQQAQANADVIATSQQIDQQNVSNTQSLLQDAADAAGNLGQAENKYIAFLRSQVNKAGNTTAETIAAQRALTAEVEKRKNALKAVAQASTDLTNARLATQLARAQATPGIKDDKVAFQAQINFNTSLIAGLRAEEDGLKRTSIAYKQKETAVQGLIQANIGLRESIKNLNGQNGFSLNDLFKEAQNQFDQFASNVSASPQTRGNVRGDLAAGILAQKPGGPTPAQRDALVKAGRTNDLLGQILDAIKENGVEGKPGKKKPDSGVGVWGKGPAGWATTDEARRLAKAHK